MLDDGCKGFLLALVPCPAAGDELEPVGRHPARAVGGPGCARAALVVLGRPPVGEAPLGATMGALVAP